MKTLSLYKVTYPVIFVLVGLVVFGIPLTLIGVLVGLGDEGLERLGRFCALPIMVTCGYIGVRFAEKRLKKKQ